MDEKIESSYLDIVTGNLVVDAIVSAKATVAAANDIRFEHRILLKETLLIDETDLCSILSNLLDNAIEACRKLSENKFIDFEMIIIKNQLSIKITNASGGDYKMENGKLKTTKSGGVHGIGIGQVKSIIEKYRGIFDFTAEPKNFTAKIDIPLSR
jgi:sensor histidine kinase regulating citrate/malate metabolism